MWLRSLLAISLLGSADLSPVPPETLRTRLGSFALEEVSGASIRLLLFEGVLIEGVRDRLQPLGPEESVWIGRVPGEATSSIVLSTAGGILSGSVRAEAGQFRIRPAGGGLSLVEEVAPSSEPPERNPLLAGPNRGSAVSAAATDDGTKLDVMVIYTPRARRAAGGAGSIESLVHLGIAETNLALEASRVRTRVRLVHLQEVAYEEAGRVDSDLEILKIPDDGSLDEVHSLREIHGADFVQLVVEEDDGCGIAYSYGGEEWAFSVVERGCIDSTYAMAHELGHNLGCDHAPEDPTTRGAFSYSHGYKDLASGFRTIMAYGPGRRVARFSSPAIPLGGLVTGTDTQDNARTIDDLRQTLARFRPAAPPPRLVWSEDPERSRVRFGVVVEPASIAEWRLFLGTEPGGADLFDSGPRSALEFANAGDLPKERKGLHARLWYRRDRVWLYEDSLLPPLR